ncbi:MAG: hypothetical protein FWE17_03030 [Alphaproteobacteria bacterium]|nr:hypothetical protein [Alphaproteobacteria bacterium]MCL2758428.1 hypothetical protein [Alphaproteobacteria bacterium]
MAFANKHLSVIAYANGFTMWHYSEPAKIADISKTGYFNNVRTLMNTGDIIIINADDNTALKKVSATQPDVAITKL